MAPKAAAGTGRRSPPGSHATPAPRAAARCFELATEAVWAAEPADVSLLHVLFYTRSGSGFNALVGTGGGAQQDRFHGGSQRLALLMAEELARRVAARRPGPADRARRRRASPSTAGTGDRRVRGAAGDRRDPADAGRAHRLRPAAARPPRPADPADAAGHGDQDDGDLRAPVLARGGALRPGDQRRRPGPRRLRQLAAGRQPRRPARLPRGAAGAPVGRRDAGERRAAILAGHARLFGAAGRRSPSASSSASGPRRSGPAAATAA